MRGEKIDELRPVSREREALLPSSLTRKSGVKGPHGGVACAVVEEEPAEAGSNGDGITVYCWQLIHFRVVCVRTGPANGTKKEKRLR